MAQSAKAIHETESETIEFKLKQTTPLPINLFKTNNRLLKMVKSLNRRLHHTICNFRG